MDDLGLESAIDWLLKAYRTQAYEIDFIVQNLPSNLPNALALALFRITQECLNNIAKHAHATKISVGLWYRWGILELEVADNGIGITKADRTKRNSFGLIGLEERLIPFGGQFQVISGLEVQGTKISVKIPYQANFVEEVSHDDKCLSN